MPLRERLFFLLPKWVQASALVVTLSLIGKAFGFWRELESARFFGVSAAVDAFVAASTLVLLVGRMSSDSFLVTIPGLLVDSREPDEQKRLLGNLLRAFLLIGAVLTVIAALALPPLVPLTFGGLGAEDQQLTIRLIKVMLPLVAGWCLIGCLGGVLNAQHRYGGVQVALILTTIGVLAVLWLAARRYGVAALSWGWSVGAVLGVVTLAVLLRADLGSIWHWDGWRSQWQVMRALLGGASGAFVWFGLSWLLPWVDRYFAAGLASGSLAALGYAQRLSQLPLEMVTAVTISVWVTRVAEMTSAQVAPRTFRVMGKLALITIPAGLALALAARPIVTFVYARGAFDAQAVAVTTGPFAMYSLGLPFQALASVLVRAFQARGLARYPVLTAVFQVFLTAALDAWLVSQGWGATGIAAANSAVAAARVGVLAIGMVIVGGGRVPAPASPSGEE